MFFDGGGGRISFLPYHTLVLTVGRISEKPLGINGRVELRKCLDLLYLSITTLSTALQPHDLLGS